MQQYLGSTAGRWLWSVRALSTQPDCKIREAAERSERLMYEQSSSRLSPLWVICIIVCLSWAVNHYRDNAITYKPSATNARELKLANAAITDMQMRQRDAAALDAKYTKELAGC